MNKLDVYKLLMNEDPVSIVFKKVDGTERKMSATLSGSTIPEELQPPMDEKRVTNPDVRPVFDIEKQGWRSFRWENLITVNGEVYEQQTDS